MSDETWVEAPLDHFLTRATYGFTNPMPTTSEGPYMVTAKDINDGRILYEQARRTSRAAFVEKLTDKSRPNIGDVLVTKDGTRGRIAIVDRPDVCVNQSVAVLQPNPSIRPTFLKLVLEEPRNHQRMLSEAEGSTIKHIYVTRLAKQPVRVPPLKAQDLALSIITPIERKIELNRKLNATLEAMARALFRDWFVDFGPTRAKMEGRAPYLSPDQWSLFPDRLDGEGKPEGWEDKPLSDFFAIVGGGTPKTSNPAFWDGPVPWFSVTDTPAPGSVFVTNIEKTITETGLAGSSARLVPKVTTIISARRTVGNLEVTGREMTFNQSCYGLQGVGAVGNWATYPIAQNTVSQLQAMAHGSVFSTITRQTFEALTLPKPSPEILEAFENAVSPLFDKILANVNESRTLAQTHDLLLPRLMSGEIRNWKAYMNFRVRTH
ncbi:MAG: restriction endonuclease subunit S [Tabrizicola sp.]|uniref:restriction endonuclease subunit S n=1 Tax=Tabrizicola sp. TaxID=2005166 RepID=UPI002ABBA551|nr:restriction endonuclease subunit S [Tabrizicola sp.]MDZ4086341.1 restriction endonuclease subunit S [Tabrizicola sp.]